MNNQSILNDVKSLCGIPADVDDFDTPLILHCNTVFSGLTQIGLGPKTGFYISDNTKLWSDIIIGEINLHNVKSYVYLKVKMLFDPPANATLVKSMENQIDELEWRIKTELENIELENAEEVPIIEE